MTLPGIAFQLLQEKIQPLLVPDNGDGEQPIEDWLVELVGDFPAAGTAEKRWLLAHTYAGVVWGREDSDGWHLSSDLEDDEYPDLAVENLLELRIFNPKGEIFVWRDGATLYGRVMLDDEAVSLPHQDESQILWGTRGVPVGRQFTRMTDGDQKLLHAVPLEVPPEAQAPFWRPLRLNVRHYISRDQDTGLARITLSRLVNLEVDYFRRRWEDGNGSQA